MGLDATAYEQATDVPDHSACPDIDGDWCDSHERAFVVDPIFMRSLDGLTDGGWYTLSGQEISVHNSYSGHGRLRNEIRERVFTEAQAEAWRVGYDGDGSGPDFAALPFVDWLYFADNEGTIGPVAARRLADAFDAHDASDWSWEDWEAGLWAQWGRMFHVAADTGLIQFS